MKWKTIMWCNVQLTNANGRQTIVVVSNRQLKIITEKPLDTFIIQTPDNIQQPEQCTWKIQQVDNCVLETCGDFLN